MNNSLTNIVKEQSMKIAQAKDLDLLMAELKGDRNDAMLKSIGSDPVQNTNSSI